MTLPIIAVICAYIIKGMTGIGNTLVFSTILSFRMNNINISPVDLIVGYPSNIYISWKERKHIKKEIWLPLSIMVLLGSIPGILILKAGNVVLIKALFGFVVTFVGVEMLIRERIAAKRDPNKYLLTLIGILSGILCGLFGIGAFLAAYTSRVTQSKEQFRANTCMVFVVENTIRMILYSIIGILNITVFKTALVMIPFMTFGLVIGMFLSNRSGERVIKRTVILLLILSGISLIINNLRLIAS